MVIVRGKPSEPTPQEDGVTVSRKGSVSGESLCLAARERVMEEKQAC